MKHTIVICMGSSCFARGNKRNLKIIEEYLAGHRIDCTLTGRGCGCCSANRLPFTPRWRRRGSANSRT